MVTQTEATRAYGYWDGNVLIEELKKYRDTGASLQASRVLEADKSLYHYGRKYFGSWGNALAQIGEDIDDHSYIGRKKKPKGYWSKEKMQEELLLMKSKGQKLHARNVLRYNTVLYQTALKEFGNWESVLESIGENAEDHAYEWVGKYGTKEAIKEQIRKYIEEGVKVNVTGIVDVDVYLYSRACKEYGGWGKALEATGENPVDHGVLVGFWTKELLMEKLCERKNSGGCISPTSLHKEASGLYRKARVFYKKWDDLYIEMGLNPREHTSGSMTRKRS